MRDTSGIPRTGGYLGSNGFLLWWAVTWVTLTTGCSSLLPPGKEGLATEYSQRCVSPIARQAPKPAHTHIALPSITPSAASRFSADAIRVAEVIEAVSLLNRLADLQAAGETRTLETVVTRQELTDRILLALLEVESSTAEIVCERDRADQVADRIDDVDGRRVARLTVLSIIFSGITGIVTGGISLASGAIIGADVANVGGGFLATLFGLSALYVHSEVNFCHERNMLSEVWENPGEPTTFAPIIWRYLHRSDHENTDGPCAMVISTWRQVGRLGEQGSTEEQRRRKLVFSTGGRYSASDLRVRASMLETLEVALRLMHEELEILIREIVHHDSP
jgi:hypothetical protein